jgi:putative addiction module antidote
MRALGCRDAASLAGYNICGYTGGMVLELKLRKIGNSLGVVLPREALSRLNVAEGDSLSLTEAADGSLRLSATRPEVVRQMEAAQDVIRRYRHTLRELAK